VVRRYTKRAVIILAVTGAVIWGGLLLLGVLGRDYANAFKCKANMRCLGQVFLLYANENRRQYPPTLVDVICTQDVGTEVFICPASSDTIATGATRQAMLADFAKPGRCSYVYIGAGLTSQTATPTTPVMYEANFRNHRPRGTHILFGDGYVEYVEEAAARKILAGIVPTTQAVGAGP
jgi:hypothetical protein